MEKMDKKELDKIPVLDDGQVYIYVVRNYPAGNIKIGKTTNMAQRMQSLSGSNGGGNKISEIWHSPSTWLDNLEKTCHERFAHARIPRTEWFDGSKVSYEEIVSYVVKLFSGADYERCNEFRKQLKSNR